MPRTYLSVLLLGIVAITAVCLGLRWAAMSAVTGLPERQLIASASTEAGSHPSQVPASLLPAPPQTAPPEAAAASTSSREPAGTTSKDPSEPRIDINTASATQFESLPGIGPVLAKRIVDYRRRIGRFKSVDQLEDVEGIGPKKLADLKGRVYAGPAD